MVQTADGSPEEGAGRQDDDMSNPMWVHIIRLLDDEEQAAARCTSLVVQQVLNERLLRVRDACIPHRRLRVDAMGDGHLLQIADGHLLEDSLIIGRQS